MAYRDPAYPWDVQPQEYVEANFGSDFASGLVVLLAPSMGVNNLIGKTAGTLDSGVTYASGLGGVGYAGDGSATGFTFAIDQPTAYTFFAVVQTNTTTGTRNICSIGTSATYAAQLRMDSTTWNFYHYAGGDVTAQELSAVTTNALHIVAGTWDGANHRFYRGGVLKATSTSASIRTTTSLKILEDNFGAKQAWNGNIYLFGYWNRALSGTEVAALSNAPYQLLAPRRSFVRVPAVAGSFKSAWAHGANTVLGVRAA